jgi:hypothetical protein
LEMPISDSFASRASAFGPVDPLAFQTRFRRLHNLVYLNLNHQPSLPERVTTRCFTPSM